MRVYKSGERTVGELGEVKWNKIETYDPRRFLPTVARFAITL